MLQIFSPSLGLAFKLFFFFWLHQKKKIRILLSSLIRDGTHVPCSGSRQDCVNSLSGFVFCNPGKRDSGALIVCQNGCSDSF